MIKTGNVFANEPDPGGKNPKKDLVIFYVTKEFCIIRAENWFPYCMNKEHFGKQPRWKFFDEGLFEIKNDPDWYQNIEIHHGGQSSI